jgi:hypothetical protein
MITILTVPKPFQGHIDIIQRNAIKSWLRLDPKCEIILFGNDQGVAEESKELGVFHVPEIENEFGLPFLNSVFNLGRKMAKNNFLVFVNTDIILRSDFIKAIGLIKFSEFLMAGRRWDLDVNEPIKFDNNNWEEEIKNRAIKEGKIHGFAGMDYFVFPRDLELNMPSFVAGRPGYDSWLIYRARCLKIPVIDATEMITIIHQNHGYGHRKGGEKVLKEEEGKWNIKLAGGFSQMLTLREADWILTSEGLKKPDLKGRIMNKLSLFYPWRLLLSLRRNLKAKL